MKDFSILFVAIGLCWLGVYRHHNSVHKTPLQYVSQEHVFITKGQYKGSEGVIQYAFSYNSPGCPTFTYFITTQGKGLYICHTDLRPI